MDWDKKKEIERDAVTWIRAAPTTANDYFVYKFLFFFFLATWLSTCNMKDDFHFRDKRDKERRRPMMTILGSRSENNKVEKKGILFNLLHYSAVSALLVYTQKRRGGKKVKRLSKNPSSHWPTQTPSLVNIRQRLNCLFICIENNVSAYALSSLRAQTFKFIRKRKVCVVNWLMHLNGYIL